VKTLIVLSIFVLAVTLLFSQVFFGPRIFLDANPYHYDPWRAYAQAGDTDNRTYRTDALFAYYPRRVELTRSIRSGRLPLWNPYILGGMPFFADPQSRVAYPIALLLTLVDPVDAMAYDVAIHLVIAMFGMYLFLGAIRVNVWGALLGGFAFGFSSFFYVRLGHPTFVASSAWMPFLFYAFERARKGGPGSTVMLAIFLAMSYLAGFPQIFLFGVGSLVLYAFYISLDRGGPPRKAAVFKTMRILLVAGGLSILLVAVQLIPFVEFMKNSTGLGVDIKMMSEVYLASPLLLLRAFFPTLFGNPMEGTDWSGLTRGFIHTYNPEFAVYCGLGTLLAAVAALCLIRTNRHVRIFTILLLVPVGLATSRVFLNLGYAVIPLLDISKISRISAVACFAMSSLGGIGLSALTDKIAPSERRHVLIAIGVAAAVVLAVGLYVVIAGDGFVGSYLARARDLPDEFWERTHEAMRSSEIRDWAQGSGAEWVDYERRQIRMGFAFLIPALGLLILLARSDKVSVPLKTGLVVVFVSLVALDAGLVTKRHFISQVASRLFETDGIRLLKYEVGDQGMWRVRSARYEHEDIKAFPPNTNLLFGIHSLNGTSTMWPKGYKELYDAYGSSRALSKEWDRQPVVGTFEALASDFGCVRYAIANNRGLPVLFPPLIRLVAARAGIPSRARIVQVGDEARLAIWQRPGETLNFAVDLPEVQALKFAVGLDCESPLPGDSVSVRLVWEQGGKQTVFRHAFDLVGDGGKWHPFSLDVSHLSGGRVRMQMGCSLTATHRLPPVKVTWSGLDLVSGDCVTGGKNGEYKISVGQGTEYVALDLASSAKEIPLEILVDGAPRRVRWVAFPPQMSVRKIFLDIRERKADTFGVRSDSAFTLLDCDVVYLDVGCPDYDLVYDKDMYIYENLTAIRKGVCLERKAILGLGSVGDTLRISPLEEIGDLECGRCDIVSYRPEDVTLDVRADSACFLLFQDVWYPGWKGYVDGVRTRILPTDIGMRAIDIQAGAHRVEMKYRPRSIELGLALTCIGIVLSVAYARKGRKKAAHAAHPPEVSTGGKPKVATGSRGRS
jgi:hypothetical protein